MTSTEPLVGRAAELESLDGALAELARRRPGVIELSGDPGIGKTRLLGELQGRADAQGRLVLSGAASELERELPFWVFVDALDEYVRGLEPGQLAALEEDERAELGAVLPALAGGAAPAPERHRLHRAMRRLLETLAHDKPLLLALDDVHWADPGSVELLGSLLRRPPDAVLIALAARPRQLPERLHGPLTRAARAGVLTRLAVGPLSEREASELLGQDVGEALYADSRGNPFYLQQLARFPGAGTVTDALAEELAPLAGLPRRMLEGAAVAGDPFEPELAAAAAGAAEDATLEVLDELIRADLVHATEVPRRFRFRHPLVRSAVYDAAPAAWRLGAHERAAAALAERGAPPLERAHHVERSARHGDDAAVAVLRAAAEAAAPRAPAIAARWFTAALRILPPDGDRVGLLRGLASVEAATGRFEAAHAATVEALANAAPDDRLDLMATAAGYEIVLGRHERARGRLSAAMRELPDDRSPAAARVMTGIAHSQVFSGDFEAMLDWATRALAVAGPLGDRGLTASSAALVALAHSFRGDVPATARACAEAAAAMAAMSDEELAGRIEAVTNLAAAEYYLDRLDEAGGHAEHAYAVARATGHGDVVLIAYGIVGTIRLARGDVRGAGEFYDAAVETTRLAANPQLLGWNLVNQAMVASAAGETDVALAALEDCSELGGALHGVALAWSGIAHGEARLATGEPARAEDLIVSLSGGEDLAALPGGARVRGLELLTRCRLARAAGDAAARSAAAARDLAAAMPLPLTGAMADLAEAAVRLASGEAEVAAGLALAAATAADGAGARLDAAAARMLAGRALAAAGEPERAADELERAAAQFEACHAIRRRDAAERELGRLGRRPHRRTRLGTGGAGIEALTERELQVARLIVDRMTNPQIAAELFLSQKTVESHVRNLFHKLGVSSRTDVARAVERAVARDGDGAGWGG